jgi:hypothetical protein
MNQKKGDIIQTIKTYFSVRTEDHQTVQPSPNSSEKERFYKDFTNLLVR